MAHTPVNYIITKQLPKVIRSGAGFFDHCVMHIGSDISDSFIGVRIVNKKYRYVWLFFTSCEIPSPIMSNRSFLDEPYHILHLDETRVPCDRIWHEINRRVKKVAAEKDSEKRNCLFENKVLRSMLRFMPSGNDSKRIVNEAYNFQFPVETGKEGAVEEEEDVKMIIDTVMNKSQIVDISMLSGYEREGRYAKKEAWDFARSRITNSYVKAVIAYFVPPDSNEVEELFPIGYIVAVDGDHSNNSDFALGIPQNMVSVISFAVHPKSRRQKVATAMFQHLLLDIDKPVEISIPFCCIEAAQLIRSLGFSAPRVVDIGEESFFFFCEENPERLFTK